MAHFDPAPHLNSLKVTSTPFTLLPALLTQSLTTLSYSPTTTRAVAALTVNNTHTVTLTGLQSLLHHPSRTYGTAQALDHLFADVAAKNTRVNTNEPVLVVHSPNLSTAHIKDIAAAAANLLRYQYHIRPVRIYAGNFGSASAEAETPKGYSGDDSYSLSLLNVVNTDIGGPGMVQLLDMVDWEMEGAIKVEIWDGSGWNMVREMEYDGTVREETGDVNGSEVESGGGASEKGEWESEDDIVDDGKGQGPEAGHDKDEHGKEAEAEAEDDPVNVVPAPDQEADITRPPLRSLKHPSWERTHDNESLLDMIAKQAQTSKLPISKGGNAYATSAIEKAGLEGEDEYEVL